MVTQDDRAGPYTTTTTRYSVSSSVVGKVITELNENGLKRQSYVHANGTVIAQQRDNLMQWVHMDPVTRSLRESATDCNLGLRLEFDPLGNDAPLVDPAPPDDPTPDYEYLGNYGNNGNPYDGPSGCMIDGQAVPCSMAMRLLSFGTSRGIGGSDGTTASATMLSQVWIDEWEDVETPAGTAISESTVGKLHRVGNDANQKRGLLHDRFKHRNSNYHPTASAAELRNAKVVHRTMSSNTKADIQESRA